LFVDIAFGVHHFSCLVERRCVVFVASSTLVAFDKSLRRHTSRRGVVVDGAQEGLSRSQPLPFAASVLAAALVYIAKLAVIASATCYLGA